MSVIQNNLLLTGDDGYSLTRSLRFRSSASAYLNRTPTTTTNQKTFTLSFWVKRGALTGDNTIFTVRGLSTSSPYFFIGFDNSTNILSLNSNTCALYTTQVFRDPSAWYHVVYAFDTTQATASNRIKLYINGSQVTAFGTTSYPSLNADTGVNSNIAHWFGAVTNGAGSLSQFFDGYLTEVNFIDGQALTPSSFGETSTTTGVWQPIRYAGTYDTNGFYLPFTDNSALTTSSNVGLGKDFSGNGNYWTTNNISITSGSTYDSMTDVPTLTSATTANYCVFNPLDKGSANFTFTNGNLNISGASASSATRATVAVSSGKWYWEAVPTAIGNGLSVGFAGDSSRFNPATWNAGTYVIYQSDGNKHINGSTSSYGASYTTNDVIGVALDMDAGSITFYKNGTSQGVATTGLTGVYLPVFAQTSGATTGTINANFGAGSGFAYTPPTGFVALNTFNLPTPTIGATASTQANDYFDVSLWTGANTNAGNSVTGLNFSPDFVWAKVRSQAYSHLLYDRLRGTGATAELSTDSTGAEGSTSSSERGYLNSFDSAGFSSVVGSNGDNLYFNQTSQTYVAWNWKANGTGVTNTAGSITSTVSANTSSGFSVVTYTGNGTGGATIGHGLGVAPNMIILKRRNGTSNWTVGHSSLPSWAYYLVLNITDAQGSNNVVWNSTAPTSTVFTVGTGADQNGSGNTIVAYCFSEVAGYSKFGSYTGNGSADGTFVALPFRPAFVMIKRTGTTGDWIIYDNKRDPYNVGKNQLFPNSSSAEGSTDSIDLLSNGFKLRLETYNPNSTHSYIYAAFAEVPFKYSLAR